MSLFIRRRKEDNRFTNETIYKLPKNILRPQSNSRYTVRGSLYRDSTVSGIDPKNVCVIRAQYVMLFFISSVLDRL